MLVGDAIHNIADGIVLVAAFSISTGLGIFAAISIFIHEFIQEISEYFVLRSSGYSNRKALAWNFVSALMIFVGVFVGVVITFQTQVQAIFLGISAGIFFQIVTHDLFPYHSLSRKERNNHGWKHIGLFLLGIGLIMLVGILTPHTHDHSERDHLNEDIDFHLDDNEADYAGSEQTDYFHNH